MTVELISVPQDYASDEDPDYVPDPDEQEDSDSLEDNGDDDNTEYENEGDEQDEGQGAKISDVTEEKAKATSSFKVAPLKEAGVVQGEGRVFNKTPTKGGELSPGVQNMVEKIEVKMSSAPQKTENVPAKERAKTGVVNEEGKHSNKTQTKVGELSQGVKNLVEKIKVKGSTPPKTENVSAKEDAKTGAVNGEGKVSNKSQTKASEQSQSVQNKGEKTDVKMPASKKTENVSLKTALRKQAEQLTLMEGK